MSGIQKHSVFSLDSYLKARTLILEDDRVSEQIKPWMKVAPGIPKMDEEIVREIIYCMYRYGGMAGEVVWEGSEGLRKAVRDVLDNEEGHVARARELMARESKDDLVSWASGLKFVGENGKYDLARRLGADLCLADEVMCEICGVADKTTNDDRHAACMKVCKALSKGSGDSVSMVDWVLRQGKSLGVF